MAYDDYTGEEGYNLTGGSYSRLYDVWQSVYSEYDSPEWFQNEIWGPFSDQFAGANIKMDFRDPNRLMEGEWSGWFSPFDPRDWESLDEIYATKESHLTEQADLITEQQTEQLELDEKVYGEKRDARIERAELQFGKKMRSEDNRKDRIRMEALTSLTNIDSIVSQSSLSSGGLEHKRNIELDSVKSELNQANMNRKLASEGVQKEKARAVSDYDSSLETANLKRDIQYGTKFLDIEQKKKTAGIDLITNKLNVYDEWKSNQVGTVNKIFRTEAHTYDPESLKEAWSEGGEEYELMQGMYDDFVTNFDDWKEQNPELWQDMQANPENYINTDARTWQTGEMGYEGGFDIGASLAGGILGGPLGGLIGGLAGGSDYGYTTEPGWQHVNLSEEQIDTALMNQIFTSGSGQWQGTKFKEEWGEWTPWMIMKDVAVHSGQYHTTAQHTWSDVDAEGNPQFLNIYEFGDFMDNPYTEALETGEYDYFDPVDAEDQYTFGDDWWDYAVPYVGIWKDYFYS